MSIQTRLERLERLAVPGDSIVSIIWRRIVDPNDLDGEITTAKCEGQTLTRIDGESQVVFEDRVRSWIDAMPDRPHVAWVIVD